MKKWNKVYFYCYNSYGYVEKKKVINIIEGTKENHNITIYPTSNEKYIALTNYNGGYELIENNGILHNHYSKWIMNVNIDYFYANSKNTQINVDIVRERNGAHEFGHILGLRDVDNNCSASNSTNHHQEIIMGYGSPMIARSQNITYKDIAGVAITRGFHTDSDHKWMFKASDSSSGNYKLICSVCNCVKFVSTLEEYSYDIYGACNNNHSLSSSNMMAVASYETTDYYKCRYCRYVAQYDSNIEQNYTYTSTGYTNHLISNNVVGLSYQYYESHTTDTYCNKCDFIHDHNFNLYRKYDSLQHKVSCVCGKFILQGHAIKFGDTRCIVCGELLSNTGTIILSQTIKVSKNGSKLLSNGIIVLVEADLELYFKGELEFNNFNHNVTKK